MAAKPSDYHFFPVSLVIGICGGSGSGKTTLAHLIADRLGPASCSVLAFDSYYLDQAHLSPSERAEVNYDHPDSLDGPLLSAHLTALAQNSEAAVPVYDFATHTRTLNVEIVEPRPVIIVEGILLLAYTEIREALSFSVYRQCPEQVRFERRAERDVHERGRTLPSVRKQFAATVKPMHDTFVVPSSDFADMVVPFETELEDAANEVLAAIAQLQPATPEN